ncbi:pyridoxamine 5'-phosphate oxidase family protein [Sorangium sp. So ce1389]
MERTFSELDDELTSFLVAQRLFFVASAPSGDGGHVNVSPKGYDTFRILDPRTVTYLDLTGSGVETIAHLRDNGRITLMFCDGLPGLPAPPGAAGGSTPGAPSGTGDVHGS